MGYLKALFSILKREMSTAREAERVVQAKKILSASDIDTDLLRKIILSAPENHDLRLFFNDGSRLEISSRDLTECQRGAEW